MMSNLLTWSVSHESSPPSVQQTAQSCPAVQRTWAGSLADLIGSSRAPTDDSSNLRGLLADHGFESLEDCNMVPQPAPQWAQHWRAEAAAAHGQRLHTSSKAAPLSKPQPRVQSLPQDAGDLVLAALWPLDGKPHTPFAAPSGPGSIQDSAQDVMLDDLSSAEPQDAGAAQLHQLQHMTAEQRPHAQPCPQQQQQAAPHSSLLVSEIRDSLEITECPTLGPDPALHLPHHPMSGLPHRPSLPEPTAHSSSTAGQLARIDAAIARSDAVLEAADAVLAGSHARDISLLAEEPWTQCQRLDLSLSDFGDDGSLVSSTGAGAARASSLLQRQETGAKQVRFACPEVTGVAPAPAWAVLHAQCLRERLATWEALQPRALGSKRRRHPHTPLSPRATPHGSPQGSLGGSPRPGPRQQPPPPSLPSRRVLDSVRGPRTSLACATEALRLVGRPASPCSRPGGQGRSPLQELQQRRPDCAELSQKLGKPVAEAAPAAAPEPETGRRAVVAEFQASFMAAKQAHASWLHTPGEPFSQIEARQAASDARYAQAAKALLEELGPSSAKAIAHMMDGRWQACEAPLRLHA